MKGGENMKVHLLNSAVMPKEGNYTLKRIDKHTFREVLVRAYEEGKLRNYIGYETNLKLIVEWCDIRLPLNREEVRDLSDGDILLVMKLKYRLNNTQLKAQKEFQTKLTEDDFEFFVATYTK